MTKLLSQNKKLAKSSDSRHTVFNFGIPAYQSSTGLRTCPAAGQCAKAAGCYALQGAYQWSNVAQAFEWRLQQTLKDNFAELMGNEIAVKLKTAQRTGKQLVIRIHDSGDFYNLNYIAKWFDVMRAFPEVQFYAYTKQVKMFKALEHNPVWTLPGNFTLIYSFGGIFDHLIDVHTDRHSAVFGSREELEAAGYSFANDNDLVAIGANHRVGLVYHGAKSKQWEAGA